jgi:hypothetical protein
LVWPNIRVEIEVTAIRPPGEDGSQPAS